jgi:hypothetical protein
MRGVLKCVLSKVLPILHCRSRVEELSKKGCQFTSKNEEMPAVLHKYISLKVDPDLLSSLASASELAEVPTAPNQ